MSQIPKTDRWIRNRQKIRSPPHLSEPDERDERDGRYICTRGALFSLWFLFMFVHDLPPPSYVSPSAAPTPELLRSRVCEARGGALPALPALFRGAAADCSRSPADFSLRLSVHASGRRASTWRGVGTARASAEQAGGERAGWAARVGRSACSAPSELVRPRSAASDPATLGQRLSASLAFRTSRHRASGRTGARGESEG